MKVATRKERRHRSGLSQRTNVGFVHLLEMIAACGPQLHRELGPTGARELFGMQPWRQTVPLARLQNPLGLLPRERATVAKNVAVFGEPLCRYFGNKLVNEQRNVLLGPVRPAAIRTRNKMG